VNLFIEGSATTLLYAAPIYMVGRRSIL